MTNLFESGNMPSTTGPQLNTCVDPCHACGNPLQPHNWTCPKCGEIAEALLLASIDRTNLQGEQRGAYQSGVVAARAWYQSQLTTEIDPANYHPTPGFEDFFRAGWKAGAEDVSSPLGLHRFFRSPFNKYSERSVFEVVDGQRVVEEVRGVERLRTAIVQGHLKRSTPIRIARDRDGLILAREAKAKHLIDVAERDLRVDSLYRPVFSYARRGAAWGFKIACALQPLIWACLLVRIDPIAAIASLTMLIPLLGTHREDFRWAPLAPLVLFAVITYVSGDLSVWIIFGSIPILAALTALPAGMCLGSVLGLVRATRAAVAVDRIWEDRTMTVIRTICVPLAFLAVLAAVCYFRWGGIAGTFKDFINSMGESGGIQWQSFFGG
jgi:hypothetical protein